jgi:hypothetical protein
MISAFLFLPLSPPRIAGALQLWDNWVAGCDNNGRCIATSLPHQDNAQQKEGQEIYLDIILTRENALGARTELSLIASPANDQENKHSRWAFAIDGKVAHVRPEWLRGTVTLNEHAARRLLISMRNGKTLNLLRDGSVVHSTQIAQIGSILRYFEQQDLHLGGPNGSAGYDTTFLKKLAASNELQSDLAIPGPSRFPANRLTSAQLTFWSGVDRCAKADAAGTLPTPQAEFHALDDDATLVLIGSSCPAYNPLSLIFIKYRTGLVRPAFFGPHPFAEPYDQVVHLPGARWSGVQRKLIARSKGRAAGDCGEYGEYAWDGQYFQLTDYRIMPVCRGSFTLVPLYSRHVREVPPGPISTEVLQN